VLSDQFGTNALQSHVCLLSGRVATLYGMGPTPVAVDEQLPQPIMARSLLCAACRGALLYQRQERPRFPRHFFWCRRCLRRYAAWETGWAPGQ